MRDDHVNAERGMRAANALEEFVGPALLEARAAYLEVMTRIAADEPWQSDKITKLAIAQRIADMTEEFIRIAIMDGVQAADSIAHARRVADIPERRRSILRALGVNL